MDHTIQIFLHLGCNAGDKAIAIDFKVITSAQFREQKVFHAASAPQDFPRHDL
jgi:hypothetical protein